MLLSSLFLLGKQPAVWAARASRSSRVLFRSSGDGKPSSSGSGSSSSSNNANHNNSSSSGDSGAKRSFYERASGYLNDAVYVVTDVACVLSVFHVVTNYFVDFTLCTGPSMLPTVNTDGDIAVIDIFSYTLSGRKYERGDVIVSVCPYDANKRVCKRITATAGDAIPGLSERGGGGFSPFRVKWFDAPAEPRAVEAGREAVSLYSDAPPPRVPQGHVWLEGDNPDNSLDSRYYGPVPLALLRGRIVAKASLSGGVTLIGPRKAGAL